MFSSSSLTTNPASLLSPLASRLAMQVSKPACLVLFDTASPFLHAAQRRHATIRSAAPSAGCGEVAL